MKTLFKIIWKWLVTPLIGLVIIIMSAWSVCAIYFAKSPGQVLRLTAIGIFVLANLAVVINVKKRRYFLIFFAVSFIAVLIWWSFIPASGNRDWDIKVSVMPRAVISNNFVTVYNIRNFDYKTADEFTTNYYNKTYDLNKLKKLYLAVSYWDNNTAIAHTMLSFEFENGDCLVLSVEVRREKGEEYSAFKSLFKMNEIIYVLADERDVIRLRTNYTHEKVFLLPLKFPPENIRKLLLDILKRVNELDKKPEFYNAIMENCTTSLIRHFANISENKMNFYIEYLLNGRLGWRLYENGVIDTQLPPKEAKQVYFISDIAKEYDDDPDFSKKIRSHLPGKVSLTPNDRKSARPKAKKDEARVKTEKDITKVGAKKQDVIWNSDYTSVDFTLDTLKGHYPEDMKNDIFPSAGTPPAFIVKKEWPNVTINAKWTVDIKNWTDDEKSNALDSILIRACNPSVYKRDYPETIQSTVFTPPPEYKKEEKDPVDYNLAKALRGKQLSYEVTANAGFGASNYKIKTKIYIGLSRDGKTLFYNDKPEYISNHLTVRNFLFAAHLEGDKIFFEVNIFCVCELSKLLRGTKMGRVESDSKYYIQQMYNQLNTQSD